MLPPEASLALARQALPHSGFSFNPINNLPVNPLVPLMASNFWASALLASFCRHAPPLRFREAMRKADKKLLRC